MTSSCIPQGTVAALEREPFTATFARSQQHTCRLAYANLSASLADSVAAS